MFLMDRNGHYYMLLRNPPTSILKMSRIFIWLESSSTLNFVSERDPGEIVQTHMLSRAFADHIRHKYQQRLYQLIWGSAQDDFMLGSELCSRKEHMHRMIEVRSVSHAAWAYCRTGKSFKILKREGRGCQSDNLRITHISA